MEIPEISHQAPVSPRSAIVQPATTQIAEVPNKPSSQRAAERRMAGLLHAPYLMALPPFPQTQRELNALLSDPRLWKTLSGAEPIESIQRAEHGYVVTTRSKSVDVRVVYKPSRFRAGPAHFELEFPTPGLQSQINITALPPLAQSLRELGAILNDRRLYEAFGSAALLESIVKTSSGYVLTTKKETLAVDVVYFDAGDGRVGPAQFELAFGEKRLISP